MLELEVVSVELVLNSGKSRLPLFQLLFACFQKSTFIIIHLQIENMLAMKEFFFVQG